MLFGETCVRCHHEHRDPCLILLSPTPHRNVQLSTPAFSADAKSSLALTNSVQWVTCDQEYSICSKNFVTLCAANISTSEAIRVGIKKIDNGDEYFDFSVNRVFLYIKWVGLCFFKASSLCEKQRLVTNTQTNELHVVTCTILIVLIEPFSHLNA